MKIDRRSLLAGFAAAPAAAMANESFGPSSARIGDAATPGIGDSRYQGCVRWFLKDLTPGWQPPYPVDFGKSKLFLVRVKVSCPGMLGLRVLVNIGRRYSTSVHLFAGAYFATQFVRCVELRAGDVVELGILDSGECKAPATVEVGWEAM